MKATVIMAFICCFGLIRAPHLLAAEPEFVYAYIEFPPLSWTENGRPRGIIIDKVRQVFKKARIRAEFTSFPLRRVYHYLESGKVHISTASPQVISIKDHIIWDDKPLYRVNLIVTHLAQTPGVTSPNGLRGKRIAAVGLYDYIGVTEFIRDPANRVGAVSTDDFQGGILLLKSRRVDYVLSYEEMAKGSSKGLRHSVLKSVPLNFVVSKKTPGAAAVLKRLKSATP